MPIAILLAAAVAVTAVLWLRRPPSARQSAARDAVAPYARATARALHGPLREGDAGSRGGTEAVDASAAAPSSQPAPRPRRRVAREAELRAENDRLRAELQLLRATQEENAALRMHLGFVERNPSLIVAEVVSSGGADAWSRRIRLGKGSDQGVRPGAPVLAPEGLVGHVVETTETTADVLLITDPNSHVACVMSAVGAAPLHGILSGSGGALAPLLSGAPALRLDYLDRNAAAPPGATVVTSGLGGLYPAGIAVGTVREVTLDTSGLYARALVDPAAPLRTLRAAYVLAGWGVTP